MYIMYMFNRIAPQPTRVLLSSLSSVINQQCYTELEFNQLPICSWVILYHIAMYERYYMQRMEMVMVTLILFIPMLAIYAANTISNKVNCPNNWAVLSCVKGLWGSAGQGRIIWLWIHSSDWLKIPFFSCRLYIYVFTYIWGGCDRVAIAVYRPWLLPIWYFISSIRPRCGQNIALLATTRTPIKYHSITAACVAR